MSFEVDPDKTTLADLAAREGAADSAANLIERLYYLAADVKAGSVPKMVRYRLREEFASRPETMPTVEAISATLKDEDPHEADRREAKRRAAERREARKEEVREAARDRAVSLFGPERLAERLGEPVLNSATGEYVTPSGSEGATGQAAEGRPIRREVSEVCGRSVTVAVCDH